MHSSFSYKARPRTLESRKSHVLVPDARSTNTKSTSDTGYPQSLSLRLWDLPSSLTTMSQTKPGSFSARDMSLSKNTFSEEATYRAATIEFFAKPLSTVAWIPRSQETKGHHYQNSLLAIGSCLGDGGDWIRLVRLQVSEMDRYSEEAVTELSLDTVTVIPIGDTISALCPCSFLSDSSSNVLLFYGTLQGQVCGMEVSVEEDHRVDHMSTDKLSSTNLQKEAIVGLTELPFGNQLVAATNFGNLHIYQIGNELKSLSFVELSPSHRKEVVEPLSFTDICTVSETVVAASGRSGSVCCFDTRTFSKESQLLSVAPSSRGVACTCVGVDSGQPNYIFAGTSQGELVVWDRRIVREGNQTSLSRFAAHRGQVSRVGVSPVWKPGVAFTCGKNDAQVLSWDFASAAEIDAKFGRKYKGANSCWEATIQTEQVRSITRYSVFSLNDMDLHPTTPLVAYVSYSSSLNVICL